MNLSQTYHRLEVYKTRLLSLRQSSFYTSVHNEEIKLCEHEIEMMENEIFSEEVFEKLCSELKLKKFPPYVLKTWNSKTAMVLENSPAVEIVSKKRRLIFDFKRFSFKLVWVIKYYSI